VRETARTVAIIPARGGSRGIPGKNLRTVGGTSLIGRTVEAARRAPGIDLVVVTSDDPAIRAEAEAFGAQTIHRPADISGDRASSEEALVHALSVLQERGEEFGIVVFLQCTSPFTRPDHVSALVRAFDVPGTESALLVSADHGFLWRRTAAGQGEGVNHDETAPRQRRQDMAPQFRENGAGYAVRVAAFLRERHRFVAPVALVETDLPIVEIDTPGDLDVVRAIAGSRHDALPAPADTLRAIRLLVTDFDGVHTDDCVYVDETGGEAVRCSRRDGMGVSLLAKAGVPTMILSKEVNPVVAGRARKLRIDVIQGVDDKLAILGEWLKTRGLSFGDIAFVGNDVNDLECLRAARLAFVPRDAHPSVLSQGFSVLSRGGGSGAVREVCDMLVRARQDRPPAPDRD